MRKARPLIILFLIVGAPILVFFFLKQGEHLRKKIDIISPKIANPDGSPDSLYHTVSNFNLSNQAGNSTSYEEDFAGRIVVASLFFSNCTSACDKLNRAVGAVHDYPNFEPYPEIRFLSLSIDPGSDSIPAMAEYAAGVGADPGRWSFVSGNKDELYRFIQEGLMLDADSTMEGVEIDTRIRLIDPEGRLRGEDYSGTSDAGKKNLIDHIKLLQLEYAKDE